MKKIHSKKYLIEFANFLINRKKWKKQKYTKKDLQDFGNYILRKKKDDTREIYKDIVTESEVTIWLQSKKEGKL